MIPEGPYGISISDYMYDLPVGRIALYPLAERDRSNLLCWNKGDIADRRFSELPAILKGNLLISNNTKVIEARLFFQTESGTKIEIFLLEPAKKSDPLIALSEISGSRWTCMVGRASKWKSEYLSIEKDGKILSAKILSRNEGVFTIEFSWSPPELMFAEILHHFGNIPLPPYLNRNAETDDEIRYQTIYAEKEGSVAAPTAGLHFTEKLNNELKKKGIRHEHLTLHVGAGTFKPVSAETLSGHEMHSEMIDVPVKLLELLARQNVNDTIAVGTTSLRSLESIYWLAEMLRENPLSVVSEIEIDQWYPYRSNATRMYTDQVSFLLDFAKKNQVDRLIFRSRLLIAPGYKIRSCGGLITNFHQPGSTLLLLVACITGNDWKKIYDHALENNYRFLSYGDSSYLCFRED